MATSGSDPIDYDKLASAIAKANAGGNSSGSGKVGGGAPAPNTSNFDKTIDAAGQGVKDSFGKVTGSAKDLTSAVGENLNTWRDLSKTGANFGNDMVAMRTAQAGSRVSLGEFTDTIQKNNTAFVGLGGNVSKGAENFAKLTKEMYDNNAVETDRLRSMGITNKELNDTLALQISFQRGSFKDTKEGHEESIKAATELADQMNKTAILTGKSRQEQEDALKKAQADSMVEAKFRLLGAKEGPEAEAKARKEFTTQMQQAEARGQGQFFKEVFATGHAISQEAATQQSMLGKQAIATAEQAKATARGDHEAASKFNEQARVEQLANSKNTSIMTAALYGDVGSAYNKQAQQQLKNDQAVYDARKKLEQDANFAKLSDQEKLAAIDKQVAEDAAAKNKDGTDKAGSASTKAAVNIEQRMNDAGSAVMKNLVTPLNDKAGPAVKGFADTVVGAQQKLGSGKVVTTPQAMNQAVKSGYEGKSKTPSDLAAGPQGAINSVLSTVGAGGRVLGDAGTAAGKASDYITDATRKTPESRDGGTLEKTGSPVEPKDVIAQIHKGEAVLKPEAVQNMGIKMSEMSKMVSTTISSASGPGVSGGGKGEDETSAIESIRARLQDRISKVAELQKAASERELSDKEKSDLRIAENGVRRAANNLADEFARQNEADKKIKEIKEESKAKEIAVSKTATLDIDAAKKQIGFGGIALPNFDEIEKKATKISPPKLAEDKAKADAEAKKKAEEAKKKDASTATTGDKKATASVGEVTLKDLNASLQQLNISMKQMLTYTQQTATAAQAQVKATKGLSGNKFA